MKKKILSSMPFLLGIISIVLDFFHTMSDDYLLSLMGLALIIYGALERMRFKHSNLMVKLFLTAIILFLTLSNTLDFSNVLIRVIGIFTLPFIWLQQDTAP